MYNFSAENSGEVKTIYKQKAIKIEASPIPIVMKEIPIIFPILLRFLGSFFFFFSCLSVCIFSFSSLTLFLISFTLFNFNFFFAITNLLLNIKDNNKQNSPDNFGERGVDRNSKTDEYEAKFDELQEFAKNREQRRERARNKFNNFRERGLRDNDYGKREIKDVGSADTILDWKLLLRREVEKTETIWSQRRSIAENNYAYRLDENDLDEGAETEVMIDVSSSVDDDLVIAFVRQLKHIVKNSTLKVGFFASRATSKFVKIKSERDVDRMKITRPPDGTNFDSAVRAFSNKLETNKIVFTDGIPGTMPQADLKNVNVIWLIYKNREFSPCCGKVINIYPKDLEPMQNFVKSQRENNLCDDEDERE